MINNHIMAAALLATLVLAGCVDNLDGAAVPRPAADPLASLPATAQADAAGLVTYLEVLAVNASVVRESADLQTVMLTRRENTEPQALKRAADRGRVPGQADLQSRRFETHKDD